MVRNNSSNLPTCSAYSVLMCGAFSSKGSVTACVFSMVGAMRPLHVHLGSGSWQGLWICDTTLSVVRQRILQCLAPPAEHAELMSTCLLPGTTDTTSTQLLQLYINSTPNSPLKKARRNIEFIVCFIMSTLVAAPTTTACNLLGASTLPQHNLEGGDLLQHEV
jgi:hypothetical protein